MNRLSACLITLNEERNLPRALSSLEGIADEIIVVDSGSTDSTEEIARKHAAEFRFRAWTNYAEQKNYAAQCASNEWILSIDADEELSSALQTSLLDWKKRAPDFCVYEMARRTWYLGAWIRHSGWYPDFQRRLYRRDTAQFSGIIHEALRFAGPTGRLHGDLLHYTVRSFAEHEAKVNEYTDLAAQQLFAAGKRSWRAAVWLATPWSWFQNFFLRGGFLDGYRGALIAQMAGRSVRLKYEKLGKLTAASPKAGTRMRVLFVDLEREWRGGQSQAFLTLRGLRDKGHSVELLTARNSPLAQRVAALQMRAHQVSRLGLRAWAAIALRRLIGKGAFDLVHLNEPHGMTAAWMAGAESRLPLLFSRRIGFPLQKNWISRRRFRAVNRFLPNCKEVAQSLLDAGIARERMAIVYEGVELPPPLTAEMRESARKHWEIGGNNFLFGCTSVFVPEKGQRHLMEALAEVRAKYPGARLLLAGDGRCRAELEALSRELGQDSAVIFAGFVENVDQVYAALDAFLFPSEFEGTGTALQAAMAWGLPCISTARGGLKEIVDNERTALVVEPRGKEFAVAMLRLLGDAGLREKLGDAGRREIENRFSAEHMVENTIRVYEDVLRKWRAR